MKNPKTIGTTSANLIKELYNKDKVIFDIKDVEKITGLSYFSAGRLISELKKRNIISSLKKGKHIIVPQNFNSVKKYLGNWFVAAKNIINSKYYYIGFYTAMDFWGMLTHPVNKVIIASSKRQSCPKDLEDVFQFVFLNGKFIFGVTNEWVKKDTKVRFSSIEKTILDGLFHPKYCGGISEIATGIYLVKDKIDFQSLMKYVEKYNKNVIAKRLGYILEILELGNKEIYKKLQQYVKERYDLFDPSLERESLNRNRWHIIDNVSPEQIKKNIKN